MPRTLQYRPMLIDVLISKVASLLTLIHPENLRLLQVNRLLRDVYRACSAGEIRRFQHLAQTHKVSSLGKLANW